MSGIEVDKLREMGREITTQDNAATADPIYVVYETREVPTHEDYDYDRIVWFDSDGQVEADEATHAQLEHLRGDLDGLWYGDDEIDLGNHDEGEEVTWTRHAAREVPEFVAVCFTSKGAHDYIKRQRHNLRKPYVYVHSLYRNPEMKTVRDLLIRMGEES